MYAVVEGSVAARLATPGGGIVDVATAGPGELIGYLELFDGARRAGNTLAVRLALPDLPPNRLARLPVSVRIAHQHLSGSARPDLDTSGRPAVRIADGVAI